MARILIGNIKGPQGEQGPQGIQGPVGPQGPKGDTGPMPTLINNGTTTQAGVGALDAAYGKTLTGKDTDLQNQLNTLNGGLSKVKVYVGNDGKLHFVNSGGADTALNFSSGKLYTGNCEYEGTDAYTASINLANISKSKFLVLQSNGVSGNSYRACIIYLPSVDMFGLLEGVSSNGFIWVSDIPYSFPTANKMTISGAIPGTGFVWRNPAGCQGIKYYAVI